MSTGLINIIKSAALGAVDNAKMCDLRYGTVISVSPLSVQVTNQFIIPQSLLIVPEHLTNRKINITLDFELTDHAHSHEVKLKENDVEIEDIEVEVSGDSHTHEVKGTSTLTLLNALKVGDKVALLRKQGGQSYFILDRI